MIRDSRPDPHRDKAILPIDEYRKEILYLLEKHQVLILVGETGCGKSTRIPQFLFFAGVYNKADPSSNLKHRLICITQPRRIAAMQLAQRVSQDLNCNLGSTVGYAVRFKDVTHEEHTMIKYMTEGLLVREMLIDPLLNKYSVIIVDEVHERSLNTDTLLGLLKCILNKRKDLKLVICSASLNFKAVADFYTMTDSSDRSDNQLKRPAILLVKGKTYPVQIYYRQDPVANYLDATVETVMNIHESSRLSSGKILVFLTGQDEIDYVCERLDDYTQTLSQRLDLRRLITLPLHASLRPEEISKVFDEHGRNTRVCIVSTNVAETSLTIENVAFVIDCGFTKHRIYDPHTGVDSLARVAISKSSAEQRAGRAGRTRNGSVYRLYSLNEYKKLVDCTQPEIQRSSLIETVMLLKSLGVTNPRKFPLISPMPVQNLVVALEHLHALQAMDELGNLTVDGQVMASFNLDPKLAKILISPQSSNNRSEACKIAAMLQVKDIYVKSGKYSSSLWVNTSLANICSSDGDMPSYLNILNGFINNNKSQRWAEKRNLNYQALLNALEISTKLETKLRTSGYNVRSCNNRLEIIQKSITAGLFPNAAYLHSSGEYRTIRGDKAVYVHPTSVFSEMSDLPKHVVFFEILNTTKTYMRHIMSVNPEWLLSTGFYQNR